MKQEKCQRCGKVGGQHLDMREGAMLGSRWCCPWCVETIESKLESIRTQIEAYAKEELKQACIARLTRDDTEERLHTHGFCVLHSLIKRIMS